MIQDGPNLLRQSPRLVQDGSKMSQDGPQMAPAWPKMGQYLCLRLSSAFILGLLGRTMALPPFCLRFDMIAPQQVYNIRVDTCLYWDINSPCKPTSRDLHHESHDVLLKRRGRAVCLPHDEHPRGFLLSFCLRFAFALPSLCFRFAFALPSLCICFAFAFVFLCFAFAFRMGGSQKL